ncbi:MAG: MBL fold metallo-hydrolase [Deltaproteobacteria bacterium]|nr:MAG: MBL fold metallo-hydrolase [Deltaproteobacteria bacterium]
MKLLERLFCYPWTSLTENNCNTYLIDGNVPTLVDVGHLRYLTGLLQSMERDGISPAKITLIISTHLHPDHHEGAAAFSQRDVLFAFHKEEERHLKAFGYQLYQAMGLPIPTIRPHFYLKEGVLRLAEEEFDIYHTPGHSPGSISLYWKQQKVLFTGDVLFLEGVGRTDFYEGNSTLLKESIKRLSQLDVEYLLPGHGRIIEGRDAVKENFRWIQEKIFPLL